jgi:hypothetical protein
MRARKSDGSPGSHPHIDRPNWRPATTIDEYVANCSDGLEQFSQRHAAKLLGWPRIAVWRAMLIAEIPADLFEHLLNSEIQSPRALAAIALALRVGNSADVETCPHCGEVIRVRSHVNAKAVKIVNKWIERHGVAQ